MNALNFHTLNLQGRILIEASAGTGKTYSISHIVLRLILEDQPQLQKPELSINDILVVTFTKAATKELRERIRRLLHQAKSFLEQVHLDDQDYDENLKKLVNNARKKLSDESLIHRLTHAILHIDEAPVFTIHGLCERLIRQHSLLLQTPVNLTLLENDAEFLQQITDDFWREYAYGYHDAIATLVHKYWQSPEALLKKLRSFLDADLLEDPLAKDLASTFSKIDDVYAKAQALFIDILDELPELFATKERKGKYQKRWLTGWIDAHSQYFDDSSQRYLKFGERVQWLTFTNEVLKEKLGDNAPTHPFFDAMSALIPLISDVKPSFYAFARHQMTEKLAIEKRAQQACFFDDMVRIVSEGAIEPAFCEAVANQYPVALIDEFQDTDLYQYRLFDQIYSTDTVCLLMIGDPKQAIYSFRGADIKTYLMARDAVSESSRYSLSVNHRSQPTLINRVNALFKVKSDPFVLADFPEFIPSSAPDDKTDSALLTFSGKAFPSVVLPLVSADDRPLTKDQAAEQSAEKTAQWIKQVLTEGTIKGDAVQPKDIAILVRKNQQADLMKGALLNEGLNSIFLSKDSVLRSDEALSLLRLFQAVISPENRSTIFLALADDLIGFSAADIFSLEQEAKPLLAHQARFYQAQTLWHEKGFFSAFHYMSQTYKIAIELLTHTDGERRWMNLQQSAECFAAKADPHLPIDEQLRHFSEQLKNPDDNVDSQKYRLETEANLINIVTIHGSKGLEYSVVCCPFLHEGANNKSGSLGKIYNSQLQKSQMTYSANEKQKRILFQEELAEEVRLLYVALTRAKSHLCLTFGAVKSIETSPLFTLLNEKNEDKIPISRLNTLGFVDCPESEHATGQQSMLASEAPSYSVASLDRPITQPFYAGSFSALALSHDKYVDDEKDRDAIEEINVGNLENPLDEMPSIFTLPKGAEVGNLLHQVLEDVDFNAPSELDSLLESALPHYQISNDPWQGILTDHLSLCLTTPLAPLDVSLSDLAEAQVKKEMGFQFYAGLNSGSRIAKLVASYRGVEPKTSFNPVHSDFKGFIDLLFCYDGKYYVLDYKSNWLGGDVSYYTDERMHQAIESHHYDVQYLLYSVALIRMLKQKLPDFDYETHFGGIYYLFLRGMNASDDSGIYFRRPDEQMLGKWDQLFRTAP
jgi:exodeoxyribonuclease V beta subunit